LLNVRDAVRGCGDRTYTGLVLRWIANAGPFWEEDRYPQADDYFQFESEDVTDQGLGEAARRILDSLEARVFSFLDVSNRFARTPLEVIHGLEEAPLGSVRVGNYWLLSEVEEGINVNPISWRSMLEQAVGRFTGLRFSPDLLNHLDGQPFHSGVVERAFALLGVLQNVVTETRPDQSLTARGLEIWQRFSTGDKAWFTDESEQNKIAFKTDLTFDDVESNAKIFCPWHGKIKLNQFRIHFEWPRPAGQPNIKVFYIGPKITKR
jgi:hypothetical protein